MAGPADIPAIIALERQTDSAAHWSNETYCSVFGSQAPNRLALVIDDATRILGFAIARVVSREWEIENIVVAAGMRQRGTGSLLLHEIINRAKADAADRILLEVRDSNFPARALYAKAGFTQSGRRTGYYRDPQEDAVCYSLELKSKS